MKYVVMFVKEEEETPKDFVKWLKEKRKEIMKINKTEKMTILVI